MFVWLGIFINSTRWGVLATSHSQVGDALYVGPKSCRGCA